jgi:hypothetical protein
MLQMAICHGLSQTNDDRPDRSQTLFSTWLAWVTNIGAHVKATSPLANTILLTFTNNRSGYLVDDATYDAPKFEVNATAPARGCAENGIVNGLMTLIKQLS